MNASVQIHGLSITVHAHVAENVHLTATEKLGISLIFGLSLKDGYCFATNRYIAERLGISESAAKFLLSSMNSKKLINIEENIKKTRARKITIANLENFSKSFSKTLEQTGDEQDIIVPSQQPKPKRPTTQININNVGSVVLTDKMKQYATSKGYTQEQTTQIFEHFLSHHTSKGSTFKNWDAAFNTWLLNSQRFDAQKKFSNGAPRSSSEKSSVGQRLMLENMLLEDHAVIDEHMHLHMIFMNQVLDGSIVLSEEYSDIGIMTLSTTKTGIKKIWYRKSKWAQSKNDDVISVEYIQ